MFAALPAEPIIAALAPDPVVRPQWVRTPKARDVLRVHPRDRRGRQLEGRATMVCTIRTTGRLTACAVSAEQPQGLGMGAAAIKLAPLFQMKRLDATGRPVVGRVIYIPVEFYGPRGD